ncbi:hypothetical protein [Megamonas hypermegale]|uniref:hypothetical protein n=1 Tax=Megamonas hypermegale TaxID=158847 RepID=UPI0026F05B98|nr:hypothetical protein [Megamonas hypermegale]
METNEKSSSTIMNFTEVSTLPFTVNDFLWKVTQFNMPFINTIYNSNFTNWNNFPFVKNTNLINNPLATSMQKWYSVFDYNYLNDVQNLFNINSDVVEVSLRKLNNPSLYNDFKSEIEPDITKISKLSNKEKEDLLIDLDEFIKQQSDIPENVLRDTPEGKKLCVILAILSGFCEAFDKFPPEIHPVLQAFIASLLALLAYYGFVLLNKI